MLSYFHLNASLHKQTALSYHDSNLIKYLEQIISFSKTFPTTCLQFCKLMYVDSTPSSDLHTLQMDYSNTKITKYVHIVTTILNTSPFTRELPESPFTRELPEVLAVDFLSSAL